MSNNPVNSKQDALQAIQNLGIDGNFITKAIGMMDSPKGKQLSAMAQMAGIDVNQAKATLQDLAGRNDTPTMLSQATTTHLQANNYIASNANKADALESLKSGLSRVK